MGVMTSAGTARAVPAQNSSAELIQVMKSTEPWVRIASATLFLSALLGLLSVFFVWTSIEGGADSEGGMFYLFVVGVSVALQFLLWRACAAVAAGMKSYVAAGDQASLVNAMKQNRGFWQLTGLLCIIGLGLMAIGFAMGFSGG